MLDFDRIETPENVELEQRLAGIGTRFIAGLLDTLLLVGAAAILFILAFISLGSRILRFTDPANHAWSWMLAMIIVVGFLLYWGFFVLFEIFTNGQSPGKKHMKIRVVKEGGGAITFTDIAIRNLLRAVDGIPCYAIAGVAMFISKKTQRLGDLAAGTVVISEETRDYSSRSDKKSKIAWDQAISAAALRATGLQPEEYRVLLNYYLRRNELSFDSRRRLLPQLLCPILQRTGYTLPDDSFEVMEEFVDTVIHSGLYAEQTMSTQSAAQEATP